MENADEIDVEVVYALPERAWELSVHLPAGSRARDAIACSGILQQCSEIDLGTQAIGIFGERVELDTVLRHGDRVEIYRALTADPKAVRRRRAQQSRRGVRRN